MKKTNLPTKRKNMLKKVEEEYNRQLEEMLKEKVTRKYKQVRMAKITYDKLKKELDDLMSENKKYSEEELLFDE